MKYFFSVWKYMHRARDIGKKVNFFYIYLEKLNLDTFLPKSQDLVHIFKPQFLS